MPINPILTLPIHRYWTTYLQAIQKSLSSDYYFYKSGFIPLAKCQTVLTKLTDYYRLLDSPGERFKRYQAGFSTVVIHLLKLGDQLAFILMCRANADKSGLFFEREKYTDARNKKHRINLNNCYELVRVNKVSYSFNGETISGENEVWTVALTEKEKLRIYEEFNRALLQRNYLIIKQICYGLAHLIGFAAVRKDYLEIKANLEKRFTKFHCSQQLSKYKVLADVYKLPVKLGYVKKAKLELFSLKDILSAETAQ